MKPERFGFSLTHTPERVVYVMTALFVAANCIAFAYEFYYLAALPVLAAALWMTFMQPSKMVLFIAFLTPLTIWRPFPELGGISIIFPTEPIIAGMMLLFWTQQLIRSNYDMSRLRHPLAVVILINLGWILFTSFTSTMPGVSFKFFASRLWYITVFFIMGLVIFRKFNNIKWFLWLYIIGLLPVIGYTLVRHEAKGFSHPFATLSMTPFFSGHGVYAAAIALLIPMLVIMYWYSSTFGLRAWMKYTALFIFVYFMVAIIFSYSRATWISLGVALGAYVILRLRISFGALLGTFAVLISIALLFSQTILMQLERNDTVSDSDFEAHVQSISNITTDASNTERINRWKAAFRMWERRPFFGWGPGTYMFQYAPFQRSYDKTIISTNQGDLGNAHSEYIGPLADSGVFGSLTVLLIVVVFTRVGMRLYYQGRTLQLRLTALGMLLGLLTYFSHGFINNYLDSDENSVLVWSFMSILVVLDYQNRALSEADATSGDRIASDK